MQRKIRLSAVTLCVAASLLTASLAGAADRFLSVIDDLPLIGWSSTGAAIWERDEERLRLGFEEKGDTLIVQFSLSPK